MATEVVADALGEEWKGCVVQISGGNDKQVIFLFVCLFLMTQGILTHSSVCSQITDIFVIDQGERTGERKCKSIHGCIVAVLNLLL